MQSRTATSSNFYLYCEYEKKEWLLVTLCLSKQTKMELGPSLGSGGQVRQRDERARDQCAKDWWARKSISRFSKCRKSK